MVEQTPEGGAVWTIPLRVAVSLAQAAPSGTPAAIHPSPVADAELSEALAELAAAGTRPYYDEASDREAASATTRASTTASNPAPSMRP